MTGKKKLKGIIPALITPLQEDGTVDFTLLEKQVAYLSSAGVHGFFVNGSTGEGPYLTLAEKMNIFKLVKAVAGPKQFLCAACLQPSTTLVLEEIRAFEPLEPDFIVAVTPYYFSVSQDVIKAHYHKIAQQTDIPVIIYNLPQCTHNKIELDTILELASSHKFAGIKDSSGDFVTFSRAIYSELSSEFSWIQGEDLLDGPSLLVGADGLVTGLGNVWIDPYIKLYQAKEQKNFAQLNELQKQINTLYEIINVVGGKVIPAIQAGTMLLGRSQKWMKIADLTLNTGEIAQVKKVLEDLELL
jgi:4-hydroxy-tetrahydrodipicolinate synthase